MITSSTLTPAEHEAFGAEIDAIRQSVLDDLGVRDTDYINNLIRVQRGLEVVGRGLFFAGFFPPAWIGGVAALGVSKILDNMEIGHNVMHGQYDWTNDPKLASADFEWDTSAPALHWKRSHNYIHHTYTNVIGKDRDVGYGLLRVSEDQEWLARYLANPVMAVMLAAFFQYGVMLHEIEIERLIDGSRKWSDTRQIRKEMLAKLGHQTLKDYVLFPALTGPMFLSTAVGNGAANLMRNLWSFSIIFCGHFPNGAEVFSEDCIDTESRGAWYERQILGSANISGGPLFHIMSGNLSHQIEHHLFPDLPAHRYAEIAPQVKAACERYGIPYTTGRFGKQIASVLGKIVKLSLPGRTRNTSSVAKTSTAPVSTAKESTAATLAPVPEMSGASAA